MNDIDRQFVRIHLAQLYDAASFSHKEARPVIKKAMKCIDSLNRELAEERAHSAGLEKQLEQALYRRQVSERLRGSVL